MNLAENSQHFLGAEAQLSRTPGVPPGLGAAHHLHALWRADGCERCFCIGFCVIDIHGTTRTMHIAGAGMAHQQARGQNMLLFRLTTMEGRAHFEQCQIHHPARLIARCGLQQTGQQRRAQVAHLRGDRVLQHGCIIATAKHLGRGRIDKAIGDAFIVAQRRNPVPQSGFTGLHRGQDRLGNARVYAGQRLANKVGQGGNARHLFHKVGFSEHVTAPAGHMGHIPLKVEAQRLQGGPLCGFGDVHADKALHPLRIKPVRTGHIRGCAGLEHVRRCTATELKDHRCCHFQTVPRECGIDPTLEPVACIGVDLHGPAGFSRAHRIKEGRFEEHVDGFVCTARGQAAHDACYGLRAGIICNDRGPCGEAIILLIEARERFTALGRIKAQPAFHCIRIEHV